MEGWDGGTNGSMFTLHTWLLYGKVRRFNTQFSDELGEGRSGGFYAATPHFQPDY